MSIDLVGVRVAATREILMAGGPAIVEGMTGIVEAVSSTNLIFVRWDDESIGVAPVDISQLRRVK